jgi:hypothetical protein
MFCYAIRSASAAAAISISLALLSGLNAAALAEVTATATDDKLQGQVTHVEKAAGSGTNKDAQGEGSFSTLSQGGLGKGIDIPLDGKEGSDKANTLNGQAETASIDIPLPGKRIDAKVEESVSRSETGVDWSAWISTLADRWYQNLKNLEFRAGRSFNTVRPALVKFTCHRNGMIGGIVLKQSSGNPKYDTMEIEALKRTMPLPPFPEGSKRVSYTLLQGWEAHPRKPGDKDYEMGTAGKDFPIERVKTHAKIH